VEKNRSENLPKKNGLHRDLKDIWESTTTRGKKVRRKKSLRIWEKGKTTLEGSNARGETGTCTFGNEVWGTGRLRRGEGKGDHSESKGR